MAVSHYNGDEEWDQRKINNKDKWRWTAQVLKCKRILKWTMKTNGCNWEWGVDNQITQSQICMALKPQDYDGVDKMNNNTIGYTLSQRKTQLA